MSEAPRRFAVIDGGAAQGRDRGHGHVFPRSDGIKARCGGPVFCAECRRDAEDKSRWERRFSGGDRT
jgi:hypothetical protein